MPTAAGLPAFRRRWFTGYGWALIASWGFALVTLAMVAGMALVSKLTIGDLTRDMATVADLPPYVGLLSNLGVLLWAASTTLALTMAALLWRAGRRDELFGFFLVLGLVTALLLGDDLFLLHEWVLPLYFGLPDYALLVVQAAGLLFLLYRFRPVYLQDSLLFLGSALAGFGASMAVDKVPPGVLPGHFLFEDGFKFFGIVNWLAFTVQSAFRYLRVAPA